MRFFGVGKDGVLTRLAAEDSGAARVAQLRLFGGLVPVRSAHLHLRERGRHSFDGDLLLPVEIAFAHGQPRRNLAHPPALNKTHFQNIVQHPFRGRQAALSILWPELFDRLGQGRAQSFGRIVAMLGQRLRNDLHPQQRAVRQLGTAPVVTERILDPIREFRIVRQRHFRRRLRGRIDVANHAALTLDHVDLGHHPLDSGEYFLLQTSILQRDGGLMNQQLQITYFIFGEIRFRRSRGHRQRADHAFITARPQRPDPKLIDMDRAVLGGLHLSRAHVSQGLSEQFDRADVRPQAPLTIRVQRGDEDALHAQ